MIAVISDSHIPGRAEEIPEKFYRKMDEASKLVHCGDFEKRNIYEKLDERYEDFTAVKGNNDFFEIPVSEIFSSEGVEIGVYHGTGIHPRGHTPTLVETAEKLEVDVLLHGHTHEQDARKKDGKILLNPGSCTGVAGATSSGGVPGMMTIKIQEGELVAELISLENGEISLEKKRFEVD